MQPSTEQAIPWILALDTSTERLCLALLRADRDEPHSLGLCEEEGGVKASARLLPAAQRLLQQADVNWKDLAAVAFGQGPGAFTGLRTACSAAQGLALGADCPVLPLDSLLLVAEDARLQWHARMQGVGALGPASQGAHELIVQVAMDARMGEIYAGTYRCVVMVGESPLMAPVVAPIMAPNWSRMHGPELCTLQDLRDRIEQVEMASRASECSCLIAGSALPLWPELAGRPGWQAVAEQASRSRSLAALARRAWADGAHLDAAQAMPLYVRDRVALTTAEREAQRAHTAQGAA